MDMKQRVHLEEDGDGRDLLGVRLEAVAQVAAVGQVQAHDAVVGLQQRCVHLHRTPLQIRRMWELRLVTAGRSSGPMTAGAALCTPAHSTPAQIRTCSSHTARDAAHS